MADLIPKQERRPIFGHIFFVIVSAVVFVAMIALFFVLGELQKEAEETTRQLEQVFIRDTRPQEQRLAEELQESAAQLNSLQIALGERQRVFSFLEFLEQTTHPEVSFSDLSGAWGDNVVMLTGTADSFFTLEQQRLVWQDQPGIQQTIIREIGLSGEGAVQFQVEFLLEPQFLKSL